MAKNIGVSWTDSKYFAFVIRLAEVLQETRSNDCVWGKRRSLQSTLD